MRNQLLLVSCVGLALLAADVGYAELLEAVDDNFIAGGEDNADVVQAFDGDLLAKTSPTDIEFVRKAYTRFDLGGHSPDGTQAATFTLRKVGSPAADFVVNVYGLLAEFTPDANELGTAWSEAEITWENAPANVNTATGFDATEASQIGSISVAQSDAEGQAYSVPLPLLGTYLQDDDTVTVFLIVTGQTGFAPSVAFASSEHGTLAGPELDFTVVPEPATCTSLLLLLMAVFALGRRAFCAVHRFPTPPQPSV